MMRCTWYNFLTYDKGYLIQLSDLWQGVLDTTFWLMIRGTWYNFLTYDKGYMIQLYICDKGWSLHMLTLWIIKNSSTIKTDHHDITIVSQVRYKFTPSKSKMWSTYTLRKFGWHKWTGFLTLQNLIAMS
jgi:hypothetical protein